MVLLQQPVGNAIAIRVMRSAIRNDVGDLIKYDAVHGKALRDLICPEPMLCPVCQC